MADPFETKLAALFDEAPEPADTAFLLAVEAKLEAARVRRRLMVWAGAAAAGLAGSVLAAATGLSHDLAELLASAGARAGSVLPRIGPPELQAPLGWSLLGLAALGLVWLGDRLFEEA